MPPQVWAGVDVGGARKGFHAAVIDSRSAVAGLGHLPTAAAVAVWLEPWAPRLVAIDSPCALAESGQTMRECERGFHAAGICGIRPTPSPETLARQKRGPSPTFYEWIENGLALYAVLTAKTLPAIECFPTASWTRWGGKRGQRSRAEWSQRILDAMALPGVPARLNQDGRDAIAAALTAREHQRQRTDRYGPIVVPRGPAPGREATP